MAVEISNRHVTTCSILPFLFYYIFPYKTTDADLKEESFRKFICENWWPTDKNLVPNDWYEA